MRLLTKIFLTATLTSVGALQAQQSGDATPAAKTIPTEISSPPYAVGDLVVEQGYYIDRGEGETRINLRFFENKFRLYWIDQDGLIAEPEASTAIVRLTGSVRGRSYHSLSPLPEGAGLGAPGIMVPPHTFNVILHIPEAPDREEFTRSFRYTPSMDEAVDPTE
jgi:hypothetical protein